MGKGCISVSIINVSASITSFYLACILNLSGKNWKLSGELISLLLLVSICLSFEYSHCNFFMELLCNCMKRITVIL